METEKFLDVKEFREKGYLQEVNRQFFHPLGLALVLQVNDNGEEFIKGIWDRRDDLEGIYYGINESEEARKQAFREKRDFINKEFVKRNKHRIPELGFDIEPII